MVYEENNALVKGTWELEAKNSNSKWTVSLWKIFNTEITDVRMYFKLLKDCFLFDNLLNYGSVWLWYSASFYWDVGRYLGWVPFFIVIFPPIAVLLSTRTSDRTVQCRKRHLDELNLSCGTHRNNQTMLYCCSIWPLLWP